MQIIDQFFTKQLYKTSNETLYTSFDGKVLIPGKLNTENKGDYYTHINYNTMKLALEKLVEYNKPPFVFLETGCSANGTGSTFLWDKFVNQYGGKVFTVDLNKEAVDRCNQNTSSQAIAFHANSLDFLPNFNLSIDFLYLDSYDVNFLNPEPSAKHHLQGFQLIKHLLHPGSIVLIDDTPISPEWMDNGEQNPLYYQYKILTADAVVSGKGSLVNQELEKMGATKILHQYQTLWKI